MVRIGYDIDFAGKNFADVVRKANALAEEYKTRGVTLLDRPMEVYSDWPVAYVPINGALLLETVLSGSETHIATRAQKEAAVGLRNKEFVHSGVYSFDSLCLGQFSSSGREADFAKRLVSVLRVRGGEYQEMTIEGLQKLVAEKPALISIKGTRISSNPTHGYIIVPSIFTEILFDARLKQEGKFDRADENGLPIFDKSGERAFYPNQGGLRGVYLGGESVVARSDNWSTSEYNSRAVVSS